MWIIRSLSKQKERNIADYFKKSEYEYEKYKSVKKTRKRTRIGQNK